MLVVRGRFILNVAKAKEREDEKMKNTNGKTSHVAQCQCGVCGRVFYLNKSDRTSWDLDFGCPYGCKENDEDTKNAETEAQEDDMLN